MRRMLLLALAVGLIGSQTGCLINQYTPDPTRRIRQLLNESENLRQISLEWERFWLLDHPSHLTPDRIDGGIAPN